MRTHISFPKLIKQCVTQGFKDLVPRMGAALAFYTAFSLAPLLIVAIAIAGLLVGRSNAEAQLVEQIRQLIGRDCALAVQAMIDASQKPTVGILSSIIGVLTLFTGATGALVELQDGLNRVWQVKAASVSGWKEIVRQRLTSLALVSGIAFLLLVSLLISAGLSTVGLFMSSHLTPQQALWHAVDLIVSWVVITALFAIIFKTLPDVSIRWSDVRMGSAVTGALFTAGKAGVGLYIGQSALTSTYGAAGSFVAILIWLYYSALVLYFGAEFTKAYADHYGSHRDWV